MAIYCITGRPRHGKTYWLASLVPHWLKEGKKEGKRIYSNFKIDFEKLGYSPDIVGDIYSEKDRSDPKKILFYWRNIDTWNFMENGRILCDEGQRYFNARNWALLSEDTEMKLQQHGKEDLDIWFTTQHYTRVDVTLRLLVERFFIVHMVFGNPNNKKSFLPRICNIKEYYLEDMERLERMGKAGEEAESQTAAWFMIRKKITRLYDTKAKVIESRPMPLKHVTRVCPDCGHEKITHA